MWSQRGDHVRGSRAKYWCKSRETDPNLSSQTQQLSEYPVCWAPGYFCCIAAEVFGFKCFSLKMHSNPFTKGIDSVPLKYVNRNLRAGHHCITVEFFLKNMTRNAVLIKATLIPWEAKSEVNVPLIGGSMCLYFSWRSKYKLALNAFLTCLTAGNIPELIFTISIPDEHTFCVIFSLMGATFSQINGKVIL